MNQGNPNAATLVGQTVRRENMMRGRVTFMTLVCITEAASISDLGQRVGTIFEQGRYAHICIG